MRRSMSVIGQSKHRSESSPCPLMTDAVEKGLSMPPARNYRISGADILNRSCALHADLESLLLGTPTKILFQQHRQPDIRRVLSNAKSLSSEIARVTR
jgi:hypothetical protein